MKFTNKIILLFAFVLIIQKANAQKPDWSVSAVDFNYSMSYVGVVYLDYTKQADDNSMIAAFVDDEVRGVANAVFDEKTGNYTFYLLAYSNIDGQTLTFKYYNGQKDEVIAFNETDNFEADGIIGSPFDPFIWANPALTEADLLSFELTGQIRSEIVDSEVNVVVNGEFDIENAIAEFDISGGAVAKIEGEIQVSGISENDFTYPLTYTVTSADESTQNFYTVNIIVNDLNKVTASTVVSPNGDGVNDEWQIANVEKFKEATFFIFDSYGHKLWESLGYDNSWNATYKGKELPTGTYYYIIKVPSSKSLSGTISIVR